MCSELGSMVMGYGVNLDLRSVGSELDSMIMEYVVVLDLRSMWWS